jgi:hypothetical protein
LSLQRLRRPSSPALTRIPREPRRSSAAAVRQLVGHRPRSPSHGAGGDLARPPAGRTRAHAARHERVRTGSAQCHGSMCRASPADGLAVARDRVSSRSATSSPRCGAENSMPSAPGCPTRSRMPYAPPAAGELVAGTFRQRLTLSSGRFWDSPVDAGARSVSRPPHRRRRQGERWETILPSDESAVWRSDRAFSPR